MDRSIGNEERELAGLPGREFSPRTKLQLQYVKKKCVSNFCFFPLPSSSLSYWFHEFKGVPFLLQSEVNTQIVGANKVFPFSPSVVTVDINSGEYPKYQLQISDRCKRAMWGKRNPGFHCNSQGTFLDSNGEFPEFHQKRNSAAYKKHELAISYYLEISLKKN